MFASRSLSLSLRIFFLFICIGLVHAFLLPSSGIVQSYGTKEHLRPGIIQYHPTHRFISANTSARIFSSAALQMFPIPPGGKKNRMEVGIQTAQLLMNSRRHDQLKKQMKKQYPLVPDTILDSCIDITAQAFTQVAPDKLKIALRPGGMDRARPDIERVIVEFALGQPAIQMIPVLDSRDKRKLIKLLVSMSLDYVLEDAQEVLSSPEVRLEALEEKMREVKQMMGPYRLFLYRVRHNLPEIGVALALSLAAALVYQQRSVPIVARSLLFVKSAAVQISGALSIGWRYTWSGIQVLFKKAAGVASMLQQMVLQR